MERTIMLEDVFILPGDYRNFGGKPTKFNKTGGARSFCISLPEEKAQWFEENGFNVQTKVNPNDPGADPTYVLNIKVSYKVAPPNVVMISANRGTQLTESTIALLDTAEIQNADIAINTYQYDVNGRQGYSAYLKDLYVTIADNPYAQKYKDLVMNSPTSEPMPEDPTW